MCFVVPRAHFWNMNHCRHVGTLEKQEEIFNHFLYEVLISPLCWKICNIMFPKD